MTLELTTKHRRAAISLTPLIDVVFILLLFFMLASNFSQERSLAITSQSSSSSMVVDEQSMRVLVRLEAGDRIILNGASYRQSSFLNAMNDLIADNPEVSVSVSVSEKVDVQSLLDLISRIQSLGIGKISMDGSRP